MVRKQFHGSMDGMRRLAPMLCLLACGGNPAITAKDFPKAFAQAVCLPQQICRATSDYVEAQCEADSMALYAPDLDKAIAKGASVFNAADAQTCIDGLKARGCERTPPEVDAACERAVTGTIQQGQPCKWIYECAQGRCDPGAPGACPATCGKVAQLGQSCGDTPCDLRAGLRCVDNVCSQLKGAGEKCSSTSDCQLDFFCDSSSGCTQRGSENAVCSDFDQCAPGLFCNLGSEGGLCQKQFTAGQSCTAFSAEAITFACADGYLCKGFSSSKSSTTAGSCALMGQVGAVCDAAAQVTGCTDGLVCKGAACALKPVDGACTSNDDCKEGVAFCNASSQCQPLIAEGQACASSDQCATSFCDPSAGQCVDNDPACHEP
jgi:hypothetical protein